MHTTTTQRCERLCQHLLSDVSLHACMQSSACTVCYYRMTPHAEVQWYSKPRTVRMVYTSQSVFAVGHFYSGLRKLVASIAQAKPRDPSRYLLAKSPTSCPRPSPCRLSQRLITRKAFKEHEALVRLERATRVPIKVVSHPGHLLARSIKDLGRAPSNPPRGWQTARKVGNMPERFLDSQSF